MPSPFTDDDLSLFAKRGATLPAANTSGQVSTDGADIWYARFGAGPAVTLLHGGLGHSGNWAHQVPLLTRAGYEVITIDSRGHGRSSRDEQPYSYHLMAHDVRAVMDALELDTAAFIGWSDGACTALTFASLWPERVRGVFFFACNMDPSGTLDTEPSGKALENCFSRHVADYKALSPTPDGFEDLLAAVSLMMKTEPNFTADDLRAITVPVTVAQARDDEFIRPEHADYLAATIPHSRQVWLEGVTHFAPLQRPTYFGEALTAFLGGL
ncbi:alpha/beta fold hydrolase [Kordiimonas gwangyangensis]|uniref:alpha/beta fold hydrolase n=1 Tax=Kordiimonas gwangyangensis TaxID=288022 RepID=UPI00036A79A7|nr:alpha/beta hydrolase [Kordiimonas gwangyangensis]